MIESGSMYDKRLKKKKEMQKKGMLSGGQAKIAAKAPPTNKIDAKDFAVLRAEKAKGRGQGLQDEKMKPGKVMKARKGLSFDEKLKRQDKGLTSKTTGKPTSMKAMREMKGFKPGESASDFNKRMDLKKAAIKTAKSSRIGKIVLPIAAAGVAAQQYLKSKMKKDKNKKTLKDFREQKKPGVPSEKTKTINSALNKLNKKMGGGMMMKPMGYKKGSSENPMKEERFQRTRQAAIAKAIGKENVGDPRKVERPSKKMGGGMMKKYSIGGVSSRDVYANARANVDAKGKKKMTMKDLKEARRETYATKKMGGGMMNKPMGYKSGKSIKVKCKLGRNKPTKMY